MLIFFIYFFSPVILFAQLSSKNTTYQARIIKPDNTPLEDSNVTFSFTILDSAGTCSLYVETFSNIDMTDSGGNVAFTLGTGVSSYISAGHTDMMDIFNNNPTAPFACQGGGTYSPTNYDSRKITMAFQISGLGWQVLPATAINSVPYANYANQASRAVSATFAATATSATSALSLNGYDETDFATSAGLGVCPGGEVLTYTISGFDCIPLASVSGTLNNITVNSPLVKTGTVSSPILSLTQAASGTDGYLSSSDFILFSQKLAATSAAITTALGAEALTVSSTINLSGDVTGTTTSNTVATVGGKSAAQVSTSVDDTLAASASAAADTIAKRDSSGNIQFNNIGSNITSANQFRLFNGSNSISFLSPVLASSYTLTFPVSSGAVGQVLTTDGSGILSWSSPSVGSVTNVSATAPLASTGGATPTISISQASPTVDGYLAAVDFTSFLNKVTSVSVTPYLTVTGTVSSPVIDLVDVGPTITSGTQYTKLTIDGKGRVVSGAQLVAADIPNLDAAKITTGTLAVAQLPSFSGDVSSVSGSNIITVDRIKNISVSLTAIASNQILQYNGSQFVNKQIPSCGVNEYLTFDGTTYSCVTDSGSAGTVTSVSGTANEIDVSGTASNRVVGLANNGVTSGTYTKVVVDSKGRVSSGTSLVAQDIIDALTFTPFNANNSGTLPLAGDVTGTLSATVVTQVGGKTSATIAATVDTVAAASSLNVSNTLVRRDGSGNFAASQGTFENSVVIKDGSAGGAISIYAPVGFTGYNLTLPSTSGTVGQVLTTNGVGILSWTDPNAGSVLSVTGTVNEVSVTGSASSPVIGLADNGVTSGTYTKVIVDSKGRVSSGTSLVAADIPNLDTSKLTTGILPFQRGGTGLNVSGTANQILGMNAAQTALEYKTVSAGANISITNNAGELVIAASNPGGTVTNVSATAPLASTGGATPTISISQATSATNGYLSFADWNIFNNKLTTLDLGSVSATGTLAIARLPSLAGDVSSVSGSNIITVDRIKNISVSLTAIASNQILQYNGTQFVNKQIPTCSGTEYLTFNGTNYVCATDSGSAGTIASVSGTVNEITVTSGTNAVISLANNGVVSGTYTKITVDSKGRVSSGTSLVAADIPNLETTKITSGTFSVARGGTGVNTLAVSGILIGNGTNPVNTVTPGSSGTVLTIDSSGTPVWLSPASVGTVTNVSATAPLASTGGATPTISISQATSATNGYLAAADWNLFNNKLTTLDLGSVSATGTLAIARLPSLVGDVSSVSGSNNITVNYVGGLSSATIATAITQTTSASSLNVSNTIVKRDTSGNFAASQGTFENSVVIKDGAVGGAIGIFAPTGFTGYNLTLPTTSGTAGQVLTTTGAGVLSWSTPASVSATQWTTSGTSIFYNSGNVGVGTVSATYPLTVLGYTRLGNSVGLGTNPHPNAILNVTGVSYFGNGIKIKETDGLEFTYSPIAPAGAKIYSGGSAMNDLRIETNSVERIRITSAGTVGIGTSSPVATLEVSGTVKFAGGTTPVSGGVLTSDANGVATWRLPASGGGGSALSAITSATTTNTIDNTNFAQTWNWSTATTQNPMSLNANALTTGSILSLATSNASVGSVNGLLYVANTGASTSGTVARFQSNSNASSGLTVKASGNVGIGVTSPSDSLSLGNMNTDSFTARTTSFQIAPSTDNSAKAYSYIRMGTKNTDHPSSEGGVVNIAAVPVDGATSYGAADLQFSFRNNDMPYLPSFASSFAQTPTVVFKASGNVGIGTANPVSKLQINGSTAPHSDLVSSGFNVNLNNLGVSGLKISAVENTGALNGYAIINGVRARGTLAAPTPPLQDDAITAILSNAYDGTSGGGGTAGLFFYADQNIATGVAPQRISFVTSTTNNLNRIERMTIKSNGFIGIGTSSPAATLDVSGTLKIAGSTTPVSGGVLTSDANGVATWRIPASVSASQWTTSGTSINYMLGDVGIGTNSPIAKLHTYGGDAFFENVGTEAIKISPSSGSIETFSGNYTNPRIRISNSIGGVNKAGIAFGSGAGIPDALIYRDAASTIRTDANFHADANLGVGGTNASYKFYVFKGTAGNTAYFTTSNASNRADVNIGRTFPELILGAVGAGNDYLTGTVSGDVVVKNNNTGRIFLGSNSGSVVISNSGAIGIGTSAPSATLDVSGTVKFAGTTTPVSGGVLTSDANGIATWRLLNSGSGSSSLSSLTSATATNTIDNTNFAQTWNWSSLTTQNALSVSASALTTGSLLNLTTSSTSLNSTNGLLYVANRSSSTNGNVARIQSNSTAGSGLTVRADGKVGIGTATPNFSLEIVDSTPWIALNNGSMITSIRNDNGKTVFRSPDAANRLTIDTSGNVGIGNTNPTATLEVSGTLKFAGSNTPVSGGVLTSDANGIATWRLPASGGSGSSSFSGLTSATTTNIIDNTNFAQTWGWSSLTTQNALSISASALTTGNLLNLTTSSAALNSTNGLLNVANTSASTNGVVARVQSNSTAGSGLTVRADGKVGIGTMTPSTQLHVADELATGARGIAAQTAGGSGGLFVTVGSRGTVAAPTAVQSGDTIGMYAATGVDNAGLSSQAVLSGMKFLATQNWTSAGNNHGTLLRFDVTANGAAAATTAMMLDQNGNVGIGTGTAAPTATLEVSGTLKFAGSNTPVSGGVLTSDANGVATWRLPASGGSGSSSFSGLTSATATNTIDNTNFAQIWNWSSLTTQNALSISASALTTGSLLNLTTSSTAVSSTNGLLYVANTGTSSSGVIARIQSNSTAGSGLTVRADGYVGIGTATPQAGLDINTTGSLSALIVPRDSTVNRPSSAVNGMIRYNNTTGKLEAYQAGAWVDMISVNTSGNHRYWGINVTASGNGLSSMAEVELRESGQSANLTGLTTSNYAHSKNGNYKEGTAVAGLQRYTYDFGAGNEKSIGEVLIVSRNDAWGGAEAPASFDVQYSDDGTNWTTSWSVVPGTFYQETAKQFTKPGVAVGTAKRWWRIHDWVAQSGGLGGARYMEVRETPGGADVFANAVTAWIHGGPVVSAYDKLRSGANADLGSGSTGVSFYWGVTPKEINEVVITARNDTWWYQAPTAFSVQSSPDGVTWTTEWSVTGLSWSSGEVKTITKGGAATRLFAQDGTATDPAISFSSDRNLGLFRPGADILAITTSGTERLRIDAVGNVGIGTTVSPTARLDVSGTLRFAGATTPVSGGVLTSDANGVATWRLPASGGGGSSSFSGLTSATATNTIDNANFAQIWGWSSLTTQNALTVSASALTTGSLLNLTTSNSTLNSTNGLLNIANTGSNTSGTILSVKSNSTAGSGLYVLANGNVGIGTSSPGQKLSVEGSLIVGPDINMNTGADLQINDQSGDLPWLSFNNDPTAGMIGLSPTGLHFGVDGGDIEFRTGVGFTSHPSLGGSVKMIIAGNGNVGIGVSSATAGLDVSGTLKFAGNTTPVSGGVLTSDATGLATWRLPAAVSASQWTTNGANIYYNSAGNVGIGLGGSTPTYKLSISGTASINDRTIAINNTPAVYVPDQTIFPKSIAFGNGLRSLSYVSGTDGRFNTAIGIDALLSNTRGSYNVANGAEAMRSNTTGNNNVANGAVSLYSNTTGQFNVANGSNALQFNTTGSGNVANGFGALSSNTTGGNNTANGFAALDENITGINNAANGAYALQLNTTGNNNTADGSQALIFNTTGSNNVAIGADALLRNKTKSESTAIGYRSMYNADSVSAAPVISYNTAVGAFSLQGSATPASNTGTYNTALGHSALLGMSSGTNNIGIGYSAGSAISTGSNNIVIGSTSAGAIATSSNNILIADGAGNERIRINSSGFMGVGQTTPTATLEVSGTLKFAGINTPVSGGVLTSDASGNATWRVPTSGGSSPITASSGTAGYVPYYLTATTLVSSPIYVSGTGTAQTVAIGSASRADRSGSFAAGLQAVASGTNAVALGGYSFAGGNDAVAIGYNNQADGSSSVSIGRDNEANGSSSIAMGSGAVADGAGSIAMGSLSYAGGNNSFASGRSVETSAYGEYSIGLFNQSLPGSSTAWVATDPLFVVGNGQGSGSTSNALVLLKNGNLGLGLSNPSARLDVSGTVKIAGATTPVSGGVLTSDASGNATWRLPSSSGSSPITASSGTAGYVAYYNTTTSLASAPIYVSGTGLTQTVAIGGGSRADRTGSFAAGQQAIASGTGSVALGRSTSALSSDSIAIGYGSTAYDQSSIVLGYNSEADGIGAVAIGRYVYTAGRESVSIGGEFTYAEGNYSVALGGRENSTSAYAQTTIGLYNQAIAASATGWVATDPLFVVGNGQSSGSTSNALVLLKNGRMGLGVSSPSETLEVSGTVKATVFISTSDRRLKENIQPIKGLSIVQRLQGVTYNWINGGGLEQGVIAQDVEKVLPSAVVTDRQSGMKAVKYQNLIAPLIESTKELYGMCKQTDAKVNQISRELASVKDENKQLKEKNRELEKRLEAIERKLGIK